MDDDIEMDDEHEHEHIDEPDYDDHDDAVDQEEDDDDMDDDDGDADADDDDDDDADDDQDDASVAASRNGLRRSAQDEALSAATYLRKVQERRKLFRPPPACIETSLGYQIEPMAAAPHSSQIHAMTISLDGQTLLTGGSDGFVRKYDVHATMNGKTMLTQNVRHGFVEGITRGGTLTAFWPNEEHLPSNGASSTSSYHPPSGAEKDRLVGIVHSLAIQQDALWGMSGSESGNIHLYGVRHNPGVTRHVFRKHKGAVSALALTSDDSTMISGGWDRGVHQWDLNTGQVVRSFPGHAGQISSISFRPYLSASTQRQRDSEHTPSVSIHPSAMEINRTQQQQEDAEDKARNEGLTVPGESFAENAESHAEQVKHIADRKPGSTEPSKSASTHEIRQQIHSNAKEADASTATPTVDEPSKAVVEKSSPKSVPGQQNGAQATSLEKPPAKSCDSVQASDGQTKPDADTLEQQPEAQDSNGVSQDVKSTSDKQISTPTADASTAEADTEKPIASEPKKETDPSVPSSLGAALGDDPTEEELAFEAELNASLGMSLDGSGATKADGSHPDSLTAGASGTTAGGLMVAGADQDFDDDGNDDDLFGGDTPPPSSSARENKDKEGIKSEANGSAAGGNQSDGDDSLFGDGDEDADGDDDADADADGDAEEDEDDGSSDEDMPLAGRVTVKNPSSQSTLVAGGTPVGTASPLPSIALPSTNATAPIAKDTKPNHASTTAPSTPPKKALPKPAFGGLCIASSFDAPLSTFGPDVMLSTSLSGQVILWDLRCPTYTVDGQAKGVHSLPLPSKIPPWCQSAVFNSTGDKVFVGRRNESVDEWDLRMPTAPRFLRSLRLPSGSGPVYSLASMPNSRHIVCGSFDNIRLWDTQFIPGPGTGGELKVPFKIVAGHHGASLSGLVVDPSCRFLISASGDRGWMGSSTEAVIIHDVKAIT